MHNDYSNVLTEHCNSLPFLSTPIDARSSIIVPRCSSPAESLQLSPGHNPVSPDLECSLQQRPFNTSPPADPSSPRPSCSYIPTSSHHLEIGGLRCIVCEGECTDAHRCPGCHRTIHTICGQTVDGMEGYGCSVWCISCWLDYRADGVRQGRLAAKRGQEKQIQRMINQSSKKIKLVGVGQNVLIPIPQVDRRSPFDPQNIPGVIMQRLEDMYQIGTAIGILDHLYTSIQFEPSLSYFLSPEDVPDKRITLRESILHSSFGQNKLQCNCTSGCNSNRCKCRRSHKTCNSKCHKKLNCHNKTIE